jgi:hypothetical protein
MGNRKIFCIASLLLVLGVQLVMKLQSAPVPLRLLYVPEGPEERDQVGKPLPPSTVQPCFATLHRATAPCLKPAPGRIYLDASCLISKAAALSGSVQTARQHRKPSSPPPNRERFSTSPLGLQQGSYMKVRSEMAKGEELRGLLSFRPAA